MSVVFSAMLDSHTVTKKNKVSKSKETRMLESIDIPKRIRENKIERFREKYTEMLIKPHYTMLQKLFLLFK